MYIIESMNIEKDIYNKTNIEIHIEVDFYISLSSFNLFSRHLTAFSLISQVK